MNNQLNYIIEQAEDLPINSLIVVHIYLMNMPLNV